MIYIVKELRGTEELTEEFYDKGKAEEYFELQLIQNLEAYISEGFCTEEQLQDLIESLHEYKGDGLKILAMNPPISFRYRRGLGIIEVEEEEAYRIQMLTK